VVDRGAVYRLRQRVGFGTERAGERVVVVQASLLNTALPTTLIVPLDLALGVYEGLPTVRVSPAEAGSEREHVALPTQVRAIAIDRLAPGAIGRLGVRTLHALSESLSLVLDL
jgi:mRNA-degrading endonuclease toxin of MazEF toxin-antitoxin module